MHISIKVSKNFSEDTHVRIGLCDIFYELLESLIARSDVDLRGFKSSASVVKFFDDGV